MFDKLRPIGYIRTSPTDQIDQQEAFKEILDLLGDCDTLIVYRLGYDEHSVVNFQQQLEAMGITLVTTNDQTGGSHE